MPIKNTERKRAFLYILFSALLSLAIVSCNKDTSDPASNNSVSLDEAYLKASQISNIKSLIVWQNGKIIKESYFNKDGASSLHDVRSVTKSVISILIGIAIDNKIIESVDQPINKI